MKRRALFTDADEAGFRRRERGGPDSELDVTPMIDVTFLLLIFFMVTSTMQGAPDLDVPVARHGTGVERHSAIVVRIRLDAAGGEPVVTLDPGDEPLTADDLRRYVEEHRATKTSVILKADRGVPHGVVQRVARAVNAVEGMRFYVGVRDEPGS